MELTNNVKRAPFKSLWAALIVIIAIIAGTFSSIFSYAALLLSLMAILTLSEEDAVCFLTFIMSFANIFKSSPEAQSFFTYLLLFYVLWALFKRGRMDTNFLLSLTFLVAFLAAQSLISFHAFRLIKFLANILFIYIAINTSMQGGNKKLYLSYVLGTALSSLTAALNIIPNQIKYIGSKDLGILYDDLVRFSGLYGDPNYYSVNLIISLCLIVVLHHKKQLGATAALLLSALMVGFAVMTVSKSAFLMLLLPLLMLLYSKIKSRKYFAFAVLLIIGAGLAISILAGKIELLDPLLSRFEAGNLTTGRADLWKNYADYFQKNPLNFIFGVGFGGALVGVKAAHNTYIDILYYLGLVGTIPLIAVFVAITNKQKSIGRRNLLNYGVILCIMFMYFFLSELFYFDWAFHIMIAILVAKMNMGHDAEGMNV